MFLLLCRGVALTNQVLLCETPCVLDICLLGTGGTLPLVNRGLTSLLVRYQGHSVLIDCGEGTQIAAQRAGVCM